MQTYSKRRIDFNEWSELADADPEAFEARRARIIDEHINRAPKERQHRLRCLQWQIDQVRKTSSTPIQACVRLNQMMWDSMLGPGGLHESLQAFTQGRPLCRRGVTAKVLPFRRRASDA